MINYETLTALYGRGMENEQLERYTSLREKFISLYGDNQDIMFFSAPGRTEVGGNHTDHNRGRVLAAAVGLDVIAAVVPDDSSVIRVYSEGFGEDIIDISDLSVHEDEKNTSASLIRGVAAGFSEKGYKIRGFRAYVVSNVLKGSGLSSSAAFEVLIGTILSDIADNGISPVEIAKIAQFAENVYFGKPSGLMDQMASSVGGFITIDFKNTSEPVIDSIPFDINGYDLFIVDTKGNHADLTPEYAAIPSEMKAVAAYFGKPELRDITKEDITANIASIRKECGDRAVSRAYHFFDENERVIREADALRSGDIQAFFDTVNESGDSSFKFLQNVFAISDTVNEGLVLGLYTAKDVLGNRGASRVHGGGFAGTIQAFVPHDISAEFISRMENIFGHGSCYKLYIRPVGGTKVE